MSSKISKRIVITLLLAAMGLSVLSCGGQPTDNPSGGDTTPSDTTAPGAKEEAYPYYNQDLGGETFTFFNVKKDLWNMICVLQPEEMTGETVNDLIFERNEFVKDQLNFEIEEINAETYSEMPTIFAQAVMAGEETYDAIFMQNTYINSGLAQNYYQCLNDVSTMHLDQPYWDRRMLEDTSLMGKNYAASSSITMMAWDSMWCLFFNESMMDDLQLEYPYQLVRDGKWTIDELAKYCKAAANLNGADSFALTDTTPAVYGCVSFADVVYKFIYGLGGSVALKDKDDMPYFNADSEAYINIAQKLAEVAGVDGEFCLSASATNTEPTYYQTIYEKQQALFLGAELKTAQLLRNMSQSFGIVPFPKLNEAQENYRSTPVHQLACAMIPITNNAPEKVGLILDALAYESDAKIVNEYFGVMVEQKGLRNQDSIDMLHIIKDTRSFDVGVFYHWSDSLESAMESAVTNGSTAIASEVAAYKSAFETTMNEMLDAMQDN